MIHRLLFFMAFLTTLHMSVICNVYADGLKNLGDECTGSAECKEGLYCSTSSGSGNPNQTQQCDNCTKPAGAEWDSSMPKTENGENSCPWTMTCLNGMIFVPNDDNNSGSCQTCEQINNNDTNYQSSLGPNSSYQVKWDGTKLQYSTDGGTTWQNDNPAQCTGKVYEISFNLNSHWAQGSQNPIYQWYGTGYYSDQSCTTTVNQIDIPVGLYQFGGYWTAQNGGVIIFEPNGSLANNVNNKQFTENATIYAHWGNQYHNNQTIPVKITVGGSASINTECKISDSTCTYTISCPDGYYATGINGNNSGWTFNSETMKLTKSFSSQEKWLCMQSSQPFCDSVHINTSECTSGSFCTQCKSEKCPYGAQSDDGATAATKCYFTRIKDNYNKDSNPWEIPVIENNRAYITQRLIESSGNPSTTTNSVEGN